jgi:hypothetical protein
MLQSSVPPDKYASRMLEFIMRHTDYDEVVARKAGASPSAASTVSAPAALEGDVKNVARKNLL